MFLPGPPSPTLVERFIATQSDLPFSYAEVGATQTGAPAGYTVDHNRIELGSGAETYHKAVAALQRWQHFDLGWVKILPAPSPVEVGRVVAVAAKTYGLWSLNACRVVYLKQEDSDSGSSYSFAYGTLPDHAESGEERFTVEWLRDNSVWYDLYAFSRPQHPLARIGFPLARRLQKRFARESLAAMRLASR